MFIFNPYIMKYLHRMKAVTKSPAYTPGAYRVRKQAKRIEYSDDFLLSIAKRATASERGYHDPLS